jgi:predicted TIM-barrel fold metal-dependent hydrolase
MCCLADPEALSGIDAMCQRFPHTPVVIDHFARIGMKEPPRTEQVDDLCRLSRFKNVYVKTSAFYALGAKTPPYTDLLPMVRRLKEAFGADRLMWGSDAPYQVQTPHTYGASLALLRDHADFLTDGERQAILGGTADKVFFSPLG